MHPIATLIIVKTKKGESYFSGFRKNNSNPNKDRLCTAFSIANAKLFVFDRGPEIDAVKAKLKTKRIKYEIKKVEFSTVNTPLKVIYKTCCFAPIMEHFYLFAWGYFDFDIRNLREDFGQPRNNETDKLNISFEARFYMIVSEVITLTQGKDLKNILQKHKGACVDVLEPIELNGKLPF